ncbi:serine-threonine protein kinase, putative, partial [Bodo saltans]
MHRGGGGATTQPGGGSNSGEDVADTMFWPCAFHVERHRVRLLQHYRVVSRFLSSRHHGSYLSIAHETQGEHPLEFLLNPVDGISLVILSDVAPQSWLAMQMETLKLIEEVSCQPAMVSPLLQQSGWIATYTRFLFLAFLEAYHSQAFSSGDAYVMSFSKGVLRALSALCQQDAVARAWALKLGIVRTLIQEIDLEQSVNDIRERQLKKSRESQSSAATTAATTANNGPRQQLLSRLASLSTGSTSDDDDGDVVSVLAQTRGDFLTSPTSLKSVGKKESSSSPAAAPSLAAVPPPSPPEQSQQRTTTAAVSPPIMSSSAATSATRSYVSPPFFSSSSSRVGGSATVSSTTVDVSSATVTGVDSTDLPKPLMTNPSTMHSPSNDSLTQPLPNTASIAPEFWSERSTDTMDTRHVSEIMGSPLSMVASHTNESSLLEPNSSLQFPSSLMTRPKISIPKLSLASAPPPLYYTSNGDTGATVEATMTNPSFVKSGSFAFPLGGGGGGGASGASFAGIPIEMHPIHTNGNDEDDESTDDRTESEHDEEREGNDDEEEIHNKNGDSGADPVVGFPPHATLSSLSLVVVPLPSSPPVAPPAGRPPLFVPKLSLASAPPPLYYTSNGDTGATVEATMTNASFVKTGSFAFASQLDVQRVQAQLNSETALMVDMHSTGDEDDDEESDEEDVKEDESCTPHNHDDNGLHSPSHQAKIGESDDDNHRPLNIQATEVTIEPCTEDDEEDAKSLASNRDDDENEGDGDGQSSPPPSSGLNSNIQILKTLPTPILLSGGRGSVSLHMAEDQFHPSEQSLSTIDSSGALHSAAAAAATAAGSTRLDNVRPSRITMPFQHIQHIPTSPSVLGDSASDSSALLHQHSSGHGLESEGSTSSVGLGVPSAPQRMISSDGAFSTASGVVYIPPLAMTQAALRNASTPHGAGRSPSARASRTVRLVEPGIGEGDAAANLGADDGQGDFELAQRSVRESSPDARIPGSTRTSASPRLGLSNPRVMYALDSTDDEVHHATAAGGASLHRSNSVLSRRSEMCSPTDSVAAAGVYPLQLVLNEAKFAAHQRSIRRIYMSSDIQVELLYLILNLVIGTNGVLEPMYTSTFTVRAGHRVQVLFHLHMHLNHDANAPAVQGLWSRLVGESGANNDRSSVRVNHSTLPPPRWYHQRSGSLHDRGMRLLFQMTCFRTNLATTYERQDKIGVGGYGAVMAAVVTLDPNGGAPGAASSTTGRSSSFVAVHHRQQELSVMSPVSSTSSASAASQRAFPTASDKIMTTDAVALVTTGGYRNERVAVKIAPVPHHIDDRETLVSFFNEVLLMTHIQDIPEAVRLLDCGCDGTQYLVVMPLYHGSAREWRLRLGPRGALPPLIATATAVPSTTSSVLPPKAASPVASTTTINAFAQCLGLYSTLLCTLCQIHRRRIVHHDLKLDNVFLEIDHHDDNDDDEDGGDEGDGGTPHPSKTALKKICRLKLGDWGEGEVLPVIGRHHHHQPPQQPQQSTYPSAANSRKVSTVAGADLAGGGGLASGGVGGETWSLENSITPQHDLPGTPVPGFGTSVLAGNSLMGYEQIAAAASSSARVLSHPAGSFLGGGASTASVIKRSGGGGGGATLFQALKQLYQKPKGTECIRSPEALLPHKYLPTSLVDKNNNNQPLSDAMNAAAAALLGSSCSSTTASSLNNTTTPQHHLYPHHHERNNAVMFADDVALIVQKSDVWAMGCLLYELLTGDALFGDQDFGQVMHRITSTDPQVFIDSDHLRALRTWGALSPISSEQATTTSSESDSAATVNENEAKRVGVAIEQYLRVLLERDPVRRPTIQQALEMWEELLCRMAWEVEDPCVVVERQHNAAAASPNLLSPSTTNDGSPAAAAGGGTLSTTVSPREHGNRTPAGGMTRASSRRNLKALQQSSILGAAMAQFASSSAARLRTMPWMLILDPSAITAALEMCDENHHHQYGSQAGNQPLSASFMNVSARSRSVSGLYQHDALPSSLMHSGSDEHHRTAILHHVAPSLSVAASRSAYGLSVGGLGSCDNSHHTHNNDFLSSTSSADAALLQCYSWGVTHLFSFYHIPKAASHFHYQHCQSTLEQVAKEITALDQLYSHTVQQQSTTSKQHLVHVNSASSFYQHHPQHQQQQQQGEQVAVGGFVAVPSPHPVFAHAGSIEASVSFDTSHVTIVGGANAAAPTAPLASAMLTASQPAPSVHPATLPPSFYQAAATTTTAHHQLMSRSSSNLSLVGAAGTVNHHYHQQHAQLNSSMTTASAGAANGGAPSWAVAVTKHLSADAVSSLLQTVPDSVVDFAHRLCHQLPAQYHDALMIRGRLLIPSFLVEDVDYAVVATLLVLSVTYRLPILSALFHVRQNCQLDPNRVNLLRTLQTAKMLLAISSLSSAPPSDHHNSISQRMSTILHEELPQQQSNIATNTTSPVISTSSSSHHASGGLQRRYSTHVDDSIT